MAGPYSTTTATAQALALGNNANVAKRPDARNIEGKLCSARVKYTLLTTEAAAEIINLVHLPKGARVIPGLCSATTSADPGTALVLDVGTYGDPDAFADGLVLSAGERSKFNVPVAPAAELGDLHIGEGSLLPASPTDANRHLVIATFATATDLNAVDVIFEIVYSIP